MFPNNALLVAVVSLVRTVNVDVSGIHAHYAAAVTAAQGQGTGVADRTTRAGARDFGGKRQLKKSKRSSRSKSSKSSKSLTRRPLVGGDKDIPTEADFVIVGGGTAGCVLAARLCSGLPNHKTVLLERGSPRSDDEEFIVNALRKTYDIYEGLLPDDSDLFNYFPTEPNPSLSDLETGAPGRKIGLIEGASIGGSSNVAFQWSYPLNGTVESWGINGLNSEIAHRINKRVEGVIGIEQPPPEFRHDYTQDLVDAFLLNNHTLKDKLSPGEGGNTIGVNFIPGDEKGRRRSSYTSYLKPVLAGVCKDSLTVIQDVTATKLFPASDDNKRINGVEYVLTSKPDLTEPYTIKARLETIVSSGMYGSPKLLQLSGIGPANLLQSKGINKILADLPVGQKTQLRPVAVALGYYTGRQLDSVSNRTILNDKTRKQFLAGEGGPYGKSITATLGKSDTKGYHSGGFGKLGSEGEPYLTLACFLNSVGFGNFSISDGADPFADPIVHSNMLSDPADFAAAVECVENLQKVMKSFPSDFGMVDIAANIPVANWVSATCTTSWHFVGGCAAGSVVDGHFKVIGGLNNLRVIDASVIPKVPTSGGLLASTYMLAEFASDILIDEYKYVEKYTTTPKSKGKAKKHHKKDTKNGKNK